MEPNGKAATAVRVGLVALESRPGLSGGVDAYTRSLVEALADEADSTQVEVEVLVYQQALESWRDRDWPRHVAFRELRWSALPVGLARRVFRAVRARMGFHNPCLEGEGYLAAQVDSCRFDVVHMPRTACYPGPLATPTVVSLFDLQHAYHPENFNSDQLEERTKLCAEAVERAALIVVPSEHTRQTVAELYGVPISRLTEVPVGIGPRFKPQALDTIREIRERYRLPEKFVFYPANPWPHKNHGRLFAALRACRDRQGVEIPVVLSGRLAWEVRDFRSLAVAAGIESQVYDLGFVPNEDLPGIYSAATLLAFPSRFEGFGIPLAESMACGCPIAASRSTSIPEVVGGAALYFDPEDPDEMSQAIWRLWTDWDERRRLSEAGLIGSRRFRWEVVLPDLLAAYRRAVRV